ncbi:GDSL-type esterase/lipase family protein [Mycolicibacterium sp. Y3]
MTLATRAAWLAATVLSGALAMGLSVQLARPTHAGSANNLYYVAVGDSYAAGYRPDGLSGSTTRDGYAYQLVDALNEKQNWELANFACTGQTAHGMQFDNGCQQQARTTGGIDYPRDTQEAAAEQFIAVHRNRVGLVTVSMGANDMLKCLDIVDDLAARTCAESASVEVRQSLSAFLASVRSLLGDEVPIVGLSYINPYRAAVLDNTPNSQRQASVSEVLFTNYLNPVLAKTYAQFDSHFVDMYSLTGGSLPDSQVSLLPGHGTVPTAVSRVCELTYFCSNKDPHPNRDGHALTARAIESAIA